MKAILKSLFFFLAIVCLNQAEKISYKDYKLLRISPRTEDHLKLLNSLEKNLDFDLWKEALTIENKADVCLPPKSLDYYTKIFDQEKLPYTIIQEDVQKLIDHEIDYQSSKRQSSIVGKFARHNEINNFIDSIVTDNPDIASTYIAGRTYENRPLKVLVLKTQTSQKSIWIDGGIHAREWIAPSSVVWFIDALIKEFRNNNAVAVELLQYYEFHILPVVNPDGYDYTFSTNRLWRKNRAPNPGSTCNGTDLNRNSGYQWMTGGSSNNPCADTFAGSRANSELEVQAVQSALNAKLGQWESYVNVHTYGQVWMPVWGYTAAPGPENADLVAVGTVAVNALKSVYGTDFSVKSPAVAFGVASGGLIDWARGVANIKYSFALELRPGQTGVDSGLGFTLPEDRAPLAGQETYVGLKAMFKAIKDRS